MTTTLAILALVIWVIVFIESDHPNITRRFAAIPLLGLVALVAWVFQLVSGWRIHFYLDAPNASTEPTRILYEDSLL